MEQPLSTSSPQTNEPSPFEHRIKESFKAEAEKVELELKTNLLSMEEFREGFIGMHGMAAAITGLKSVELPNGRINGQTANEVADTIYKRILKIQMLHFMINKNADWMADIFLMFVYYKGMTGAVKEELSQKAPAKPKPEQPETQTPNVAGVDGTPTADQLATLTGGA